MMLSSTALRLTRSASPSLSNFTSTKTAVAPSLCQLFDTSLRLSSTTTSHEPSPKIITTRNRQQHYPRNIQLQSPAFTLGTRCFSSKSNEPPSDDEPAASKTNTGNRQHETWVEFQKSISVAGFETGQTTKVTTRTKKRGGTIERKRRQREEELDAALRNKAFDITTLKGGEYPPLRYSEEETQRLLEEAYANIPPRMGKRGTRHMKREKRRWFIKRMYDARKKHERMAEHTRRMEKRHRISKWMHDIREGAEEVRSRDKEYQRMILNRWAEMNGYAKKDMSEGGRVEQNE